MNYSNQLASYKNAAVTVQKTKQVVLLYDAVIRFLQQAKAAIEAKDHGQRLSVLEKASNILAGLHNSLDHSKGGDIAKVLDSFYTNIELRVMSLNRSNDAEECEKIVEEVKAMRQVWDEIDKKYASGEIEGAPAPVKISTDDNGGTNFNA